MLACSHTTRRSGLFFLTAVSILCISCGMAVSAPEWPTETATTAAVEDGPIEVATGTTKIPGDTLSGVDIEGPLIDSYVDLPFEIRDATSTSQLMSETQLIINATQVVVPAGARPVHLIEVIKDTLDRNFALQAARLTPRITGTSVDSAWATFDPTAFAMVTYSRANTPSAGLLSGDTSGGATINKVKTNYFGLGSVSDSDPGLGARQMLTSGTQFELQTKVHREDSSVGMLQPFDQEYYSTGSFSMVHPLMQGSGATVNLASVRIAYNNTRISELDLRQLTLDTLNQAHQAYWELVFARINLAITIQSLGLAADLLRENRIRYKYGDLIAVDVLEAEATVKQREQSVIAAQNSFENARDAVRQLTAVDRTLPGWEAPLVPVDPPVFSPIMVDETLSLDVTLRKNPGIQSAKLAIQNAREGLLMAQDRFRPQLDVIAGLQQAGLGETLNQSKSELFGEDYLSGTVGLQYEMPLYRRRERADIMSSNYQISQADYNLKNTEQSVVYSHREAVRQIEDLRRSVEAAGATVRAQKDRLEKQKISHEQGVTTSHDLLEVQDSFAQAQVAQIRVIVNYYLSLIELERIRGTLIDTLGMELVPMTTVK